MNAPEKVDHAYQNAKGWAESIAEMVAALECDYDRLEELRDERENLVSNVEDARTATEPEDADERAEAFQVAGRALTEWDEDNGDELRELIDAATIEGEEYKDDETARQRITESPLSVEVRSGWTAPGSTMEAEDFCILLSTGGPALRIRGELGEHNEPQRAWLEYQDWGTPWTEYHGDGCEHETLLTFCRQFYFDA